MSQADLVDVVVKKMQSCKGREHLSFMWANMAMGWETHNHNESPWMSCYTVCQKYTSNLVDLDATDMLRDSTLPCKRGDLAIAVQCRKGITTGDHLSNILSSRQAWPTPPAKHKSTSTGFQLTILRNLNSGGMMWRDIMQYIQKWHLLSLLSAIST